jgi:DNA-binding HxlR family transcriptional regulator
VTLPLSDVLTVVGERWTLLVVREVGLGVRRFDELQAATGAPRAVLSDRLRRLVDAGLLQARPYQNPGSRGRHEYVLSDAGTDLVPVLAALSDWGERHLGPGDGSLGGPHAGPRRAAEPQLHAEPDVAYRHRGCGHRVTARLVCACGEQVSPGPQLVASVHRPS